jgi:PAS domain S-box-containing protein
MAEEFTRPFYERGAQVIAPLTEQGRVIGFFVLGTKPFENPYFSDDADLLATLANQAAVAIRNAQTHQKVVRMHAELQKIVTTIESGVVAVGSKGKVTLFNPAAEQLTGFPAERARGQLVAELPQPLARLLAATLADGQPRSQVEFSLPDSAGQLVPLVCSTSPLVNPRGAALGAVAVISDLSRLKELELERRRAERLASSEAIASGLVHEIRNPLVALKTFSQLLPTRYLDAEYRELFVRTADREIRRIDELLTRFRTLSSTSTQPLTAIVVVTPIHHTLDLLRPQLEERQIRLRYVSDGAARRILGYTSQLEQLFLNLCLNALEAMGPGGELTVRIADLAEASGTTLLVEVSDTGAGIPEELMAKVFEAFVTTKPGGTGLGLAICRGIADAHRARLTVRNNSGRPGCTFTIEFPIAVLEHAPLPT